MYRTAVVTAAALALAVLGAAARAAAAPQVPCYFIFGDSLVDNGNNNFIVSMARANYPPYGIDFAGGPTGRFSNGLTTVDVIGKLCRCRPGHWTRANEDERTCTDTAS